MALSLADVRIVRGPSTVGIPYPVESSDVVGLTDPEELRNRLNAQAVAREILPCIDTRATHWRYYLLVAPSAGKGRPIEIGRRLLSILTQTQSRAGIGRRELPRVLNDGRRSHDRFVTTLKRRYLAAYRSATQAFWGTGEELPTSYPGEPTLALLSAAREYVLAGDFRAFFDVQTSPDKVRHLFRSRLLRFRPGLASFLVARRYDLAGAAASAAASSKLNGDDRLLFLTWSVLQAYYGIADDGIPEEPEDEDERTIAKIDDRYYRTLARASLDLMDRMDLSASLSPKQIRTIRDRLTTALRHGGSYQPPVRVWGLRTDGTKRRVFASLRLYAFVRLLRATGTATT